ncbi:MAG TPA: PAS domain S-box protein, partial [Candidatus Methylacidiphilales bacterium]
MAKSKGLAVGEQVMLIFGLICAILVAIGLFQFFSLHAVESHIKDLERQILREWVLTNTLSRNLRREQTEIYRQVRAQNAGDRELHAQAIADGKEKSFREWDDYGKIVDNATERDLYARAVAARTEYWAATDSLLSHATVGGDLRGINSTISEQVAAYETYEKVLTEIADWTAKEGGDMALASTQLLVKTQQVGDVLVGLAMLVTLWTGFALTRVTRRLKEDNLLLQTQMIERLRAEEDLRGKTALLEAQLNSSLDGILVVDPQGSRVLQNDRVNELWRIPPDIARANHTQHIEFVKTQTKNTDQFMERVDYLNAHPDEVSRDEIELIDGTILDRYSSPVIGKDGEHYGRIWTFRDITVRKRLARQLNRMFELSEDLIFTAGFDGYFREVNPAFEKILGFSREELLAEPFLVLAHPDEKATVTETLRRTVAEGRILGFENRCRCKDGSYKWLQINAVSDPKEKLYYIIARDITEQRRAGRELDENRRLLDGVLKNSLDGIVAYEAVRDNNHELMDFRFLLVNPAAERLLGHPASELIGHGLLEASPEIVLDGLFESFFRIIQTGETHDFEYSAVRPTGLRWYRVTGVKLGDGLVMSSTDITERKLAQERIDRLRNEHKAVLNSVTEGVHWIAEDGSIKFENIAAATMLGYETSELLGRPAHQTMHHSHEDGSHYLITDCPIYATLHDGQARHVKDEVFWRKDGTSFHVEYTATPVRSENGETAGAVVVFTDITDRKRLEARLFQSQKMETVGKLAGGVAHEFNSILTAIIGQSELLVEELPPDGVLGKSAREIRMAADRAATLTRQLLAYGRKQLLQPQILDLNRILTEMVGTLQHLMGKEVDVRMIPALGLHKVKIDPGQMDQVILSIAMNAADAMPNGGKFTIETSDVVLDEDYVRAFPGLKAGPYVMLALSDTGIGMTEEVMSRAFEPFFSTKGVGQGTGLGLATCYGIVKQSDGHITVYSEVARGSTFRIYLP